MAIIRFQSIYIHTMTDVLVLLLVVLSILFLTTVFLLRRIRKPKKQKEWIPLPDHLKVHLIQVPFYNRLSQERKKHFEGRVQQFLSGVRITGVNTEVTESDRILVAASATIPIFNFNDWEYPNLNEVLFGREPKRKTARAASQLLDYWQPPYTYIHAH